MANVTCLAVARDSVLKRAGWDAASHGLIGAPPLTVIAGQEAHATIFAALRLLGLGRDAAHLVAADDQGAHRPGRARARAQARRPRDRLRAGRQRQLRRVRPAGADRVPVRAVRRVAARRRRVRPVGGGLARSYRHLTRGARARRQLGHRRAQVAQRALRRRPGDRQADRAAHRARDERLSAAYLVAGEQRDNYDYTPEASRRARGFAALRRAALARPPRPGRAGRAQLRAGAPLRGAARGRRRRDPQRRRAQPGAGRRAARAPSRGSRPTARAGSAARSGAAATRSASRARTGRRPTPTSSARRGDPSALSAL